MGSSDQASLELPADGFCNFRAMVSVAQVEDLVQQRLGAYEQRLTDALTRLESGILTANKASIDANAKADYLNEAVTTLQKTVAGVESKFDQIGAKADKKKVRRG